MAAAIQQRQHCGEVFITNNYLMMVECKFCCEQYTAYDKFLNHIFDYHFDAVDKFDEVQDEPAEYDDGNLLNSLNTGEDNMKQECITMLTESKEALKTIDTSESRRSAEVNQPGDTDEFDGDYLSTELTLRPSKVNSNKETKPNRNTNPVRNPDTDTSSKYRPVVIKYRTFPEGEDRKLKCKICGYTFAQMHNLRSHEKRHSTNKPFPCTKCNKRFFTRTELDTHIRRHTGERPFVCTYCGSGFITNGALNTHEKRHQDKRNYKCDECGKQFFDGYQLRIHAVVHTRERNYKCEQCEATFTRGKSLRNHMKLHENALRYECNICNMRFNQKPSLIWHEKSKHAILRRGVNGAKNVSDKGKSMEGADISETECKRCDLEFEDKKSLLNHQSAVHADADTKTTKAALKDAESDTMVEFLAI